MKDVILMCVFLIGVIVLACLHIMPRDWLDIPDGCGNVGEDE